MNDRLFQDEPGYECQRLGRWFSSRLGARHALRQIFAVPCCECGEVKVPPLKLKTNLVFEAIEFFWGGRCPEREEGCLVCEAWQQYDNINGKRT